MQAADGWNDLECNYVTLRKVHWIRGDATVFIDNPPRRLRVSAQLCAGAIDERDLEISLRGRALLRSTATQVAQNWDIAEFEIMLGRNTMIIRSNRPGVILPGKDRRRRGFVIHDLRIRLLAPAAPEIASVVTNNP